MRMTPIAFLFVACSTACGQPLQFDEVHRMVMCSIGGTSGNPSRAGAGYYGTAISGHGQEPLGSTEASNTLRSMASRRGVWFIAESELAVDGEVWSTPIQGSHLQATFQIDEPAALPLSLRLEAGAAGPFYVSGATELTGVRIRLAHVPSQAVVYERATFLDPDVPSSIVTDETTIELDAGTYRLDVDVTCLTLAHVGQVSEVQAEASVQIGFVALDDASDYDGDGRCDVFDLMGFLDDWFPGHVDLNSDRLSDQVDLLLYLEDWFGCA